MNIPNKKEKKCFYLCLILTLRNYLFQSKFIFSNQNLSSPIKIYLLQSLTISKSLKAFFCLITKPTYLTPNSQTTIVQFLPMIVNLS